MTTNDHQWPSDHNCRAGFGAFSGFSPHHLNPDWTVVRSNLQKYQVADFSKEYKKATPYHFGHLSPLFDVWPPYQDYFFLFSSSNHTRIATKQFVQVKGVNALRNQRQYPSIFNQRWCASYQYPDVHSTTASVIILAIHLLLCTGLSATSATAHNYHIPIYVRTCSQSAKFNANWRLNLLRHTLFSLLSIDGTTVYSAVNQFCHAV